MYLRSGLYQVGDSRYMLALPIPQISAPRASGFPQKDMGSMSNQNCCKGLHFTEKVEKH